MAIPRTAWTDDSGAGTDGTILNNAEKVLLYDQMDDEFVHANERIFTETNGAGVYTASVTLPAGATLIDIIVNGVALWTATTSANMKVGDAGDDDGYYTNIDLKATDLLAGESLSFALAGGKAGAHIANSQVSPRYLPIGAVIAGIITTVGAAGTAGRTRMTVIYSTPFTILSATKV